MREDGARWVICARAKRVRYGFVATAPKSATPANMRGQPHIRDRFRATERALVVLLSDDALGNISLSLLTATTSTANAYN